MKRPAPADPLPLQLSLLRIFAAFTYPFACIPFLYFYFLDHGVSPAQYGTLISIYYLSMVAVEIPTGMLADRFGLKLAMVIGPTLLAVGFAVVWWFDSFAAFCVGEATFGIGHSVLSGPPSALLFQSLRRHGQAVDYQPQESRIHAVRLLGTGVSFLVGGVVAWLVDIRATILLTAVLCLVASAAALFLHDDRLVVAGPRATSLWRSAWHDMRNESVRWVVAYFVLLFWLLRFPFHTYQPFLHAAEQRDPLLIGFLFFALNLLAAPCSRLAPYLSRRVGERTMFWLMPLSLAISLVLMAGQLNAFGIALFFAHQVPFGLHWALVQSFVNHRIQDASRATVLSVLSFAGRLCFALTFPFVMGLGNVTDGYRWAGIGGCIATAIVMVPGRRHVAGRRAEAAQ